MFWNKYPYTDAHELNLDWIIATIKSIDKKVDDFEAMNKITFSGAWDITKQYPAWTIVNDSGAGYISIRPVPSGIVLSNNDYWRGVVDYTATIADLQNRVITLEGQMSAVTSEIGNKNFDVGYMLMLTDSFGENVTPNICNYVPAYLGLQVGEYQTHARGGCGFGPSCPYNYLTELQSITIPAGKTVKTILVTGGSNDAGYGDSDADLLSAISAFMSYCASNFPHARVYFAFTGWTLVYSSANWNPGRFRNVLSVWEQCTSYGAFFLKGIHSVMHIKANFNGDDIHPTASAQIMLGRAIVNALVAGSANVHIEAIPSFTVNADFTLGGTFRINERIDNESITSRITQTSSSPRPRVQKNSNLHVGSSDGAPAVLWLGTIDNTAVGNAGDQYISASYIGMFTCTELTQYTPIRLVRQGENIGLQLCLPAGDYTTPIIYLPYALEVQSNIYEC